MVGAELVEVPSGSSADVPARRGQLRVGVPREAYETGSREAFFESLENARFGI